MLEMTEREKFLFDLQGFLHIKEFLTPDEVKALNDAVDANVVPMEEYEWKGPSTYGGGMGGEYRIRSVSGMLTWDQPWCQPFRDLLAHPKLIPYMNSLFGRGWRCEGEPGLIMARKGCGGHGLHGFTSRQHDGSQHYTYANGQFRTGMSVIQYQLHDIEEGMGGVTVVPGSHKANFKCPEDIMLYEADTEVARNIGCKAGDLVIGDARLLHSAHANKSDQRRTVITLWYFPYFDLLSDGLRAAIARPREWVGWDDEARTLVAAFMPVYAGSAEPVTWNQEPGTALV